MLAAVAVAPVMAVVTMAVVTVPMVKVMVEHHGAGDDRPRHHDVAERPQRPAAAHRQQHKAQQQRFDATHTEILALKSRRTVKKS